MIVGMDRGSIRLGDVAVSWEGTAYPGEAWLAPCLISMDRWESVERLSLDGPEVEVVSRAEFAGWSWRIPGTRRLVAIGLLDRVTSWSDPDPEPR